MFHFSCHFYLCAIDATVLIFSNGVGDCSLFFLFQKAEIDMEDFLAEQSDLIGCQVGNIFSLLPLGCLWISKLVVPVFIAETKDASAIVIRYGKEAYWTAVLKVTFTEIGRFWVWGVFWAYFYQWRRLGLSIVVCSMEAMEPITIVTFNKIPFWQAQQDCCVANADHPFFVWAADLHGDGKEPFSDRGARGVHGSGAPCLGGNGPAKRLSSLSSTCHHGALRTSSHRWGRQAGEHAGHYASSFRLL